MLRNARRAGPRQKKDIQSILSKIRRFGIKQQKLHRERVSYLVMDVPQSHTGGETAGLLGRKAEEREKGDARILGSGDFVNDTLTQSETVLEKKYLPKRPIEELIEVVAGKLGLKPELICSGNRQRQYSEARSVLAWLAVEEVGHPAAEVARFLGISRMGVQKAVIRGREFGRQEMFLER